jgi:hypothetical protein
VRSLADVLQCSVLTSFSKKAAALLLASEATLLLASEAVLLLVSEAALPLVSGAAPEAELLLVLLVGARSRAVSGTAFPQYLGTWDMPSLAAPHLT